MTYKCNCNKIFEKKKSFTNHNRWCSNNKKYNKFRNSVKDKISIRMIQNNPMKNIDVAKKVSITLKQKIKEGKIIPYFRTNISRKNSSLRFSILNKTNNPQKRDYNRKRMKENNPMFNSNIIKKMVKTMHKNGIYGKNGKTAKLCSERLLKNPISKYCKSPSKPQLRLYKFLKRFYLDVDVFLNYKITKSDNTHYYLDIAIPCLMLNYEYDGKFWHSSKNKYYSKDDEIKRDSYLKSIGWNVIRIQGE